MKGNSKRLRAVLSVLVIALALAPPGIAQVSDDTSERLAGFKRVGSGLYRVPLADGTSLLTHGYDLKPAHGSFSWISSTLQRQPKCATDYHFHVLYGRKASNPDAYQTRRSEILRAVKNANYLLDSEGVESGNHHTDYKVLCDGYGEIEIGSFTSSGDGFQAAVDGARAAGYNKSNVKYWIFFDTDSTTYCGISSFTKDERAIATNGNNYGGSYSLSHRNCWNGRTPMHEVGHAMGAVQYNAPSSTGTGGHCNEDVDVMCYSPDGGDKNQSGTVDRCTDHTHFDCQHDTYFDTEVEAGEYLANNWNVGSTLNRFLAFDQTPVPPTNRPPTAKFSWTCPASGCRFTDGSSDFDGTIVSRLWQFGDGSTSTAQNPTRVYPTSGQYTVNLTVTDDRGTSVSVAKPVAFYPQDPDPATPNLLDGISRSDAVSRQGSWKYFKVVITDELPSLRVTLDGGSCTSIWPCDRNLQLVVPQYGYPDGGQNLDLYTRVGSKPTTTDWVCRPYASHSDESCAAANPLPGIWYIGINTYWLSPADRSDPFSVVADF